MKREIKEKMEDIILTKLEELKDTEDPEKRKELIAEISKMCNMKNEEEKIDLQWDNSYRDSGTKVEELEDKKKDRFVKIGITLLEVVPPLIFYGRWMKKGFKFEETGTYSSPTFRGLIKFFKPTKR